jgi:hypothetical protein
MSLDMEQNPWGFCSTSSDMRETRVLIRLLQMYFSQNWEFGSVLTKLQNFRGV